MTVEKNIRMQGNGRAYGIPWKFAIFIRHFLMHLASLAIGVGLFLSYHLVSWEAYVELVFGFTVFVCFCLILAATAVMSWLTVSLILPTNIYEVKHFFNPSGCIILVEAPLVVRLIAGFGDEMFASEILIFCIPIITAIIFFVVKFLSEQNSDRNSYGVSKAISDSLSRLSDKKLIKVMNRTKNSFIRDAAVSSLAKEPLSRLDNNLLVQMMTSIRQRTVHYRFICVLAKEPLSRLSNSLFLEYVMSYARDEDSYEMNKEVFDSLSRLRDSELTNIMYSTKNCFVRDTAISLLVREPLSRLSDELLVKMIGGTIYKDTWDRLISLLAKESLGRFSDNMLVKMMVSIESRTYFESFISLLAKEPLSRFSDNILMKMMTSVKSGVNRDNFIKILAEESLSQLGDNVLRLMMFYTHDNYIIGKLVSVLDKEPLSRFSERELSNIAIYSNDVELIKRVICLTDDISVLAHICTNERLVELLPEHPFSLLDESVLMKIVDKAKNDDTIVAARLLNKESFSSLSQSTLAKIAICCKTFADIYVGEIAISLIEDVSWLREICRKASPFTEEMALRKLFKLADNKMIMCPYCHGDYRQVVEIPYSGSGWAGEPEITVCTYCKEGFVVIRENACC
jgi:hypothetical protein